MKKTLIKLSIGCLLLLGAYSVGRWSQPAKVITKEEKAEIQKKEEEKKKIEVIRVKLVAEIA